VSRKKFNSDPDPGVKSTGSRIRVLSLAFLLHASVVLIFCYPFVKMKIKYLGGKVRTLLNKLTQKVLFVEN
jgi:hypothetical protein